MDAYQKFINQHAADLPQTGFDYQFHCFLYYLLSSEQLDEVIYENEDDIEVIRNESNRIELIQVKHSVDKDSINLTNLDKDLWIPICNWIKQCNIYNQSYKDSFMEKYNFILVTNKLVNCDFINKHKNYKERNATEEDIRLYLGTLKSKNTEVQDGINALLSLNNEELRIFLTHFSVVYIPNMLEHVYNYLRKIYYSDERTNEVLSSLLGQLYKEKYDKAIDRYKVRYFRKDFEKSFITILQGKNPNLPQYVTTYDSSPKLPNNYSEMNLFKQLHSIEIINLFDEYDPDISKNYALFFHYQRNIDKFIANSLIDNTYISFLEDFAKQSWERIFQSKQYLIKRYKGENKTEFIVEKGAECFLETMKIPINSFDYNFSNGCFLKLSNEEPPQIGWHNDWHTLIS